MIFYILSLVLIFFTVCIMLFGLLFFVYIKFYKLHIFFNVFDRLKTTNKEIKVNSIFNDAYKFQENLFKKYLKTYKWLFISIIFWAVIICGTTILIFENRVGYYDDGYDEIEIALSISQFNFLLLSILWIFFFGIEYNYLWKTLDKFKQIKEKCIVCLDNDFYLPSKKSNVYSYEEEKIKKYNSKWFVKKYKNNAFIMFYFFMTNIENDQYITKRQINLIIDNFNKFFNEQKIK